MQPSERDIALARSYLQSGDFTYLLGGSVQNLAIGCFLAGLAEARKNLPECGIYCEVEMAGAE